MELYEIVNRYHIGTNYSCAESILLGCEEYYHLNLPEQARKLFTLWAAACRQAFLLRRTDGRNGDLGLMTTPDGAWNSDNRMARARGGTDERIRAV